MQPLDSTPSLQPHYRPSSLLRVDPSQCCASVLSPRGFCHLCFSLDIAATGSRSSTQKPETGSRPLYAGRRLPSSQVPGKLIPRARRPLGFDDKSLVDDASSKGSLSFDSLIPTGPGCPRTLPQRSPPCLLNTAAWGGLKPAPESGLRGTYPHLPCSFSTVRPFSSNFHSVLLRHTIKTPVQTVLAFPVTSDRQRNPLRIGGQAADVVRALGAGPLTHRSHALDDGKAGHILPGFGLVEPISRVMRGTAAHLDPAVAGARAVVLSCVELGVSGSRVSMSANMIESRSFGWLSFTHST